MTIIIIFIEIGAVLIMLLSFINFRIAISLYLGYIVLVPFLQVNFLGLNLSYNLVNIVLLIAFFYLTMKKGYTLNFIPFKPYLFLMLILLLLIPFQRGAPFNFQLLHWRSDIMNCLIFPFIIWNMLINDDKALEYLKWSVIITSCIACFYCFYLATIPSVPNPYIKFLSEKYSIEGIFWNDVRMFGRLTSTFPHPMNWNNYLIQIFVCIFCLHFKFKKLLYILLLNIVVVCVIISGTRSGMATLFLIVLYTLFTNRSFKTLIAFIVIIGVFCVFVMISPILNELLLSMIDIKGKTDVGGSSIQMRVDQLNGCFDEISNCFLQGKGYSWSLWYHLNHSEHPVIQGFESLLFMVLCNSGIIGLILWTIFFISLIHTSRKLVKMKKEANIVNCLIIGYFSFSLITGDYGYIKFFMIYYALSLGIFYKKTFPNKVFPLFIL
jgi:hypothetical protein